MPDRQPLTPAEELALENTALRQQLQEAEDLITAIRTGTIDALAVQGADGPRIFTLEGADQVYRTLIEEMNEGALLLAQDGTILYANASLAALLSRPLTTLMGSTFLSLVPDSFVQHVQALVDQGWRGKAKGEVSLHTQSGMLLPFSLSMNVLDFANISALAVIVTDVSAQREITAIQAHVAEQNTRLAAQRAELQRQEAARQAGERAAAEAKRVLEGIPQIAWTATPTGETTSLNRRWFDYSGQPFTSLPHTQLWGQIHPADLAVAKAQWIDSLRTHAPWEVECRIQNLAGEYRWMLGRALPSYNEQHELVQWIGTYTDIHEHKLAQERIDQAQLQLQQNNQQLKRANIDLDNFVYTASHDLRAPISNIEGLLYALLQEIPVATQAEGEVQPILQMMQDSVDRFKKTINHLTDVSKLQREFDQPVVAVELLPVVLGVQLDLAPLIEQTTAEVIIEVAAKLFISLSEKNLRSVVYNLLSNAIKYRHPERPVRIQLSAKQEANHVVLRVQDNGLGLDENSQRNLFTMFQRFHDHVEGSGIGLYMIKKIVENMGGWIEVHSNLQAGSTFSVYFKS
ncbi:PAS domain-containing sensor histidine kinase [Hymenobacter mucosus]|uniref:histidine kinase n=1 Tax=Hymenobacter mucosus TaxID=1411120 RepID=A0A238V4H3_9BACT|nr:PAS domain-containing sensor histidine kinase [Hymenobacter mucosus]SNR29340.1 Signal transduction histidine kinase [Hymenobacter mucosus]